MNSFANRFIRFLGRRIKVYINNYSDPLFREWYFKYAHKLTHFKDKHKGHDCFIIGNGPSLKSMDLDLLKNYHTFGLNKIYLLFDKVDLNLSYHVAVNNLVIEQSAKDFEKLSCPSFLSYRVARKLIRPLEHIYFIHTGGPYMFQKDLTQKVCEGHTVTYVAMQIAFYMGFQRVFLIGVDHNFKAIGGPNERQFLSGKDPNHFDPQYFGNKEWHLPDIEASELSYHLAKFHYQRSGRQIIDATDNGKLYIFPKLSFEEALDMCNRKQ
jgi:hypothetical protein